MTLTTCNPSRLTMAALALVAATAVGMPGIALAEGPGPEGGPGMGPAGFNFAEIDTDKDGKITLVEIEAFHTARLKAADTNADGKLSAEELAAMDLARMQERANDRAARMIARMDSDKDGVLSIAELTEMSPGPERMFKMVDADNDGAITQAEADAAKDRMQKHRSDRGDRGDHHHKHGKGGPGDCGPDGWPDDGPDGGSN